MLLLPAGAGRDPLPKLNGERDCESLVLLDPAGAGSDPEPKLKEGRVAPLLDGGAPKDTAAAGAGAPEALEEPKPPPVPKLTLPKLLLPKLAAGAGEVATGTKEADDPLEMVVVLVVVVVLLPALATPKPKVRALAVEEAVLIPVKPDDGTIAGAAAEAEELPEMPNAAAAVLAPALVAGVPNVKPEGTEDPPRKAPTTPLLAAVPPPPPAFGVSHEAHLVSPGSFLTRQASHFHCPGLLNFVMSKPPVTGAGAGEEPPLARPPPAPSPPTDAEGCTPKIKPVLLVGPDEAAGGVDEDGAPKMNPDALGAAAVAAAVAAAGAPKENGGPDEAVAFARMPPPTEAAVVGAPPLAPGFGVSHEAHFVSPGSFLTRQASHFHCPGLLNLVMSKPPAAGAGAEDALLVAAVVAPLVAPPPKVNGPVTAGMEEVKAAPADPPTEEAPPPPLGCPPKMKGGLDEEAAGPNIPPEAPADPALAPGLRVSHETHLSVPGGFLTKQASHFHSPGFENMDMVIFDPLETAPEAGVAEAPAEPDACGRVPPLLPPPYPLVSATARGATARGAICSAALLPAATPALVLRAFRGLVENSKCPGASFAMWSLMSSPSSSAARTNAPPVLSPPWKVRVTGVGTEKRYEGRARRA